MKHGHCARFILALVCLGVFSAGGSIAAAVSDGRSKNQPVAASAGVDKTSVAIGDKFTYVITVESPKNTEVEFPEMLSEGLGGFAIKDSGSSPKGFFGKMIFRRWYLLDTYVSGEHVIPASVVKYRVKGGADWQELSIKEVKLNVKSVLEAAPKKDALRDIRGPKSFSGGKWRLAFGALIVLFAAGAAVAFFLLRKKKAEFHPPPVPAHVIACEALTALEKKDYVRAGRFKAFYTELSDIVRRYLENRFHIRAPQMSTEEFLFKVREDSALSFEHKGLLRDFLASCDLVKFAKHQPAAEEANASLASAKRLIDQTKEEADA